MASPIELCKQAGRHWVNDKFKGKNCMHVKVGGIKGWLNCDEKVVSDQSVSIKIGHFGEFLAKEMVKQNSSLTLLQCGVQMIGDKKMDVDLLFRDNVNNIIYYREMKSNVELDTEKLPATVAKCKTIELALKERYPDAHVNSRLFHWTIYNRNILFEKPNNCMSYIQSFEEKGLKIDHMEDFLSIVGMEWSKEDYEQYGPEIKAIIYST